MKIKKLLSSMVSFSVVLLFLGVIFFMSGGFYRNSVHNNSTTDVPSVKIGGVTVKVDLAETPSERAQGLSGRAGLSEEEGLLFVFEYVGKHAFWMKDMNFPIDIIWIGENGEIVYIKKDARPESYPQTFQPDENAKYVLEVVSGFSEKYNLKEGDMAEFTF